MRTIEIERRTKETSISLILNLDGTGKNEIDTGIGFMDHMLNSLSFYSGFDIFLKCKGDLEIDDHHTIEDIGIVLGQGLLQALGDRRGIQRFSNMTTPMDESLATVSLDIGNRPYLVYNLVFNREKIGQMDTQNFKEFFRAFAFESRMTLHVNLIYGENEHHKIEAVFKSLGRALKDAARVVNDQITSTKGVL
ncbi:MAG: imidazoleglycerol-phosphate dehydratase HisB [Clostridiales bacterium]|nr:imidazoleglycerol-phosphate dehydratase HisB [Clostridiales bacterium]